MEIQKRPRKKISSLNDSSDEGATEEDFDMSPYSFDELLDTPNHEEIEKEFSRKKTEVLVNIIVSHPNSTVCLC